VLLFTELTAKVGNGDHQAASLFWVSIASSPPVNVMPWMTFGNWFLPLGLNHRFSASFMSLKTITLAVLRFRQPLVLLVLWRTVAKVLSIIDRQAMRWHR